jgi:hypothetical protein
LPPLVTTSPPGTPLPLAGVLGAPATSVLFGGDSVNGGLRSGARISAGYWMDRDQTIEASAFILGDKAANFARSSTTDPILAMPFVNALTGLPDSIIIAFPGQSTGSVAIRETSQLFGTGAFYRRDICAACGLGHLTALVGYRFLRLEDNLGSNATTLALGGVVPAGTTINAEDQFTTVNTFHGLDLGLRGDIAGGPWMLTWTAKVAFGGTFSDLDINGSTTITAPGGGATVNAGGIHALPTNIGSYSRSRFAVAPELSANVSYQLSSGLRAFAGYSVLYWTGVVRPGGTIDGTINPSQIGGPLVGPARPLALTSATSYWAQGLNIGLAYQF